MKITDKALEKIALFQKEDQNKAFYAGVTTGGCSGFQYKTLLRKLSDGDLIVNENPVVVTDELSSKLLEEVTLDYEETISRSGFVFINPGATATCGCGVSFDIS